jgi:surface protein
MPNINAHSFIVPAEDGDLYDLNYTEILGGSYGCTMNVNNVLVNVSPYSSFSLNVKSISATTGCYLGGERPWFESGKSFISTWLTNNTSAGSSTATQIRLPLISTGTYRFIVEWGDGTSSKITSWNQAETTHTYTLPGIYQIKIIGVCYGWRFANTGDRLKLIAITQWGNSFRLGATDQHFYGCANLTLNNVSDVLNLTDTTTLASSFRGCSSITTINKSNEWNVSNITSLDSTFFDNPNFNSDISNWNISNVTTLNSTFFITTGRGLFNQDITNWDTTKVTTLYGTFYNQVNFNKDLSTKLVTVSDVTYIAWDVSNVTTMAFMFGVLGSSGIFNQDIGNWNTSKVNTMQTMFQNQVKFNQDLSTKLVTINGATYRAWDVANVTNMSFMFNNTSPNLGSFNNGGSDSIRNWNTGKVTTMQSMFQSQPNFNQDIGTKLVTISGITYSAWDVVNVINMSNMFNGGSMINGSFNNGGSDSIKNWNTSKVTTMQTMFQSQPNFNQDIGTKLVTISGITYSAWSTSNVTSMSFMFNNNLNVVGNFNNGGSDSIKNWDTSKVTTMQTMFYGCNNFNQDIGTKLVTISGVTYSAWSTSNVTSMSFMLGAKFDYGNFNNGGSDNIKNWNTSKVTNINSIYFNQNKFNQPINSWDTKSVSGMSSCFYYATGFNQPINNWVVSGVTSFSTTTTNFMEGKTFNDYSTTNYDSLLIGWASRPVKPNLIINFGTIKYTNAALSARTILISAPNNWTIIDGGII